MSDSIAVLSHYVSFELPFCIAEVPEMERTAITGTAARTLKEACTKKKLFQRQSSPRLECVCVHTRPAQVCIYVYTLEATEPKAMRATDDMSQIQRVETSPGLFVLGIKFGPSKKMGDISSSKLGGGNSDRGKIALRKLLIPKKTIASTVSRPCQTMIIYHIRRSRS